MDVISHRELRNRSAEILRRVADGETILVTNHGKPAAMIGPPPHDTLEVLALRGELRRARIPITEVASIDRTTSQLQTAEILDDVRGDQ